MWETKQKAGEKREKVGLLRNLLIDDRRESAGEEEEKQERDIEKIMKKGAGRWKKGKEVGKKSFWKIDIIKLEWLKRMVL